MNNCLVIGRWCVYGSGSSSLQSLLFPPVESAGSGRLATVNGRVVPACRGSDVWVSQETHEKGETLF